MAQPGPAPPVPPNAPPASSLPFAGVRGGGQRTFTGTLCLVPQSTRAGFSANPAGSGQSDEDDAAMSAWFADPVMAAYGRVGLDRAVVRVQPRGGWARASCSLTVAAFTSLSGIPNDANLVTRGSLPPPNWHCELGGGQAIREDSRWEVPLAAIRGLADDHRFPSSGQGRLKLAAWWSDATPVTPGATLNNADVCEVLVDFHFTGYDLPPHIFADATPGAVVYA
jgi:hypothetical protein